MFIYFINIFDIIINNIKIHVLMIFNINKSETRQIKKYHFIDNIIVHACVF